MRWKQWLSPSRKQKRESVVPEGAEQDNAEQAELREWQSSIELRVKALESAIAVIHHQTAETTNL